MEHEISPKPESRSQGFVPANLRSQDDAETNDIASVAIITESVTDKPASTFSEPERLEENEAQGQQEGDGAKEKQEQAQKNKERDKREEEGDLEAGQDDEEANNVASVAIVTESCSDVVTDKVVSTLTEPERLAKNWSNVRNIGQDEERDREDEKGGHKNEALEERCEELGERSKKESQGNEAQGQQEEDRAKEKQEKAVKNKEQDKRVKEGDLETEDQGEEREETGQATDEIEKETEKRCRESEEQVEQINKQSQSEKEERDKDEQQENWGEQQEQRGRENYVQVEKNFEDFGQENQQLLEENREQDNGIVEGGAENENLGKKGEKESHENAKPEGSRNEEQDQSKDNEERLNKTNEELPSSKIEESDNKNTKQGSKVGEGHSKDKERSSEDKDESNEDKERGSEDGKESSEDGEESSEDEEESSEYEEECSEDEKQESMDEMLGVESDEQVNEDEERGIFTGDVNPVISSGCVVGESTYGIVDSRVGKGRRISCDGALPDHVLSQAQHYYRSDAAKVKQAHLLASGFSKFKGIEELDSTCINALKPLKFFHTHDDVSQVMKQFVRQVFGTFSDKIYQQFQEQAMKEVDENSGLSLTGTVINGSISKKGRKGPGEVYVKLGIVPRTEEVYKRKPRERCLQEMEHMVEGTFHTPPTSNLIWNKAFELEIPCGLRGCLLLEVWSKCDESQKGEVKTFARVPFRQTKGKKKFIGYAVLPLKEVDMVAGKQTLKVFSCRSETKSKGTITVELNIHGSKRDLTALQKYYNLLRAVISHESTEKDEEKVKTWNGRLSEEATKLLSVYSSFHCLTNLKQKAILLSVLIDYRLRHGCVQMAEFQKVILQIQSDIPELKLCYSEADETLKMCLLDDLKKLWTYVVEFIQGYFTKADFGQHDVLNELESALLVLKGLHDIDMFAYQLEEDEQQCHQVLCHHIQSSVSKRFHTLAVSAAQTEEDAEKFTRMTDLCETCLEMLETIRTNVHPVFHHKVDVDCYSIVFVSFEELLEREIKEYLASGHEVDTLATFKVYQTVRKFLPLATDVNPCVVNQEKEKLAFQSFHCWFDNHVDSWIGYMQKDALKMLDNLIMQDQGEADLSFPIPLHALSVDVIFLRVAEFWNHLCWPDKVQSCNHCFTLAEILCDVAMRYARNTSSNLGKESAVDSCGKLPLTQQVCRGLNGIEHVRSQFLNKISDMFEMGSFWSSLESEESTSTLDIQEEPQLLRRNSQAKFEELISSTREKMLSLMVQKGNEMLSPLIHLHLSKIVNSSSSATNEKQSLLQIIQDIIKNLRTPGYEQLFFSILEDMWLIVLQGLREQRKKLPQSKLENSPNLLDILDVLKQVFHSEGFTDEQLCNKEYEELVCDLKLAKMTADELQLQCLNDLSSIQVKESMPSLGTLHFSHRYVEADKILEVEVVTADILIGSDEIKPFVELLLRPKSRFPNVKPRTLETTVQRPKNNYAVYYESFKPAVKKDSLEESGSVLVLVVWNKLLFKKEFLGMCVISGKSIPSGDEVKMEHCPLFQFPLSNKSFVELLSRKHEAVKFCDEMKKLVVPVK